MASLNALGLLQESLI
jgi:hypothetical protein